VKHKTWSDELKYAMMKGYFCSNERLSSGGNKKIVCNSIENLVRMTKKGHSQIWLDK